MMADSSRLHITTLDCDRKFTPSITRPSMPTPNTLARLEDPRAWHARGEVGIQYKRTQRDVDTVDAMVALPMAPPPPRGRAIPTSKVVLEEEEYVERLGDIIEDVYYPHNAKMFRALTRLAHRGPARGASNNTTPSGGNLIGTPSSVGSSTPGGLTPAPDEHESPAGDNTNRRGGRDSTGGALTRFVATHTSEDNQAFAELQEKEQEAFRKRYFWAYEPVNGDGVSLKLLMMPDGRMMSTERRAKMDAACADRSKIGDHRPNQVETWKHRTRNQLMFSPNIAKSNDTCRIEGPPPSSTGHLIPPLLTEDANARPRSKRRLTRGSVGKNKQGKGELLLLSTGESDASEGETAEHHREKREGGVDQPELSAMAAVAEADSFSLTPDPEGGYGGVEKLPGKGPGEKFSAEGEKRREAPEESKTEGSEGEIDSATTSASNSDDARSPLLSPRYEGSAVEAPRGGRRATPLVVKNNPKVIQAHATRFPMLPPPRPGKWASPIESPSSSRKSVADLIAAGEDAVDYSEVPMTPSKVPGVDGDSPQITWGSIDGTPMILDPRNTPLPDGAVAGTMDVASMLGALGSGGAGGGPRFEIKDLPAREKLAHRLEADDTRRKRSKLGPAAATATLTPSTPRTPGVGGSTPGTDGRPRSARSKKATTAVAASLTPAARTLAAKLARKRSAATPFGGGLTPGRQARRSDLKKGDRRNGPTTPAPNTPGSVVGQVGSGTPVAGSGVGWKKPSSLTDGLLVLK